MNQRHHQKIRRLAVAVLTGVLAAPVVWAAAPVPVQARVRCAETFRGTHTGTINVPAGEKWCLKGVVQDGDVNVAAGGSLVVVRRSTIIGTVNMESGFKKLKFCKSETAPGAMNVLDGTGAIKVGVGDRCPGNTFDGVVTMSGNELRARLGRSTISGAVNLSANGSGVKLHRNVIGGAVSVSSNLVKTRISKNTITGALTCTDNTPDPVNAGDSNEVTGARTGETCADPSF